MFYDQAAADTFGFRKSANRRALAKQLRDAWIALHPQINERKRSASVTSEEVPLAKTKPSGSRAKKNGSKPPTTSLKATRLTKEEKADEKAREKASSLQTMLEQFRDIVTDDSVYLRVVRYEVSMQTIQPERALLRPVPAANPI